MRLVRDDGRVRLLMPLPDRDFDVTEVAVPWRVLRDAGCEVVFATERGGTVTVGREWAALGAATP